MPSVLIYWMEGGLLRGVTHSLFSKTDPVN